MPWTTGILEKALDVDHNVTLPLVIQSSVCNSYELKACPVLNS